MKLGAARVASTKSASPISIGKAKIDERHELLGVTYGVLDSPLGGGYQLITMPTNSVEGAVLKTLRATPVPEPHLLILQGVGVLAVAGLGYFRRRRRERSTHT